MIIFLNGSIVSKNANIFAIFCENIFKMISSVPGFIPTAFQFTASRLERISIVKKKLFVF
jgi:hypothetical protein